MSEIKKLTDLQPDDHNANRGNPRGLGMLDSSLRQRGAGRSILLDRNLKIIAGNKTHQAAVDIGLEDVIIVKTRGDQLVAVQREDLDLDDPATGARELAYLDNRTSEVGLDWDPAVVVSDLELGLDLSGMWTPDELSVMLEGAAGSLLGGDDVEPQIDKAAELKEKWGTESGQAWQLGEHRIACGDCTDPAVVESVMRRERAQALITDPPYGIGIVGKNNTAGNFPGTNAPRLLSKPILGDDRPFDPFHLLELAPRMVLWGANHYADKLPSSGKWLVWDKKDGAFAESDLGDCELAWTNLQGTSRLLHHTWQGMYRKGAGERAKRVHPTQKPVDLMAWCIEQCRIPEGGIVIDCFLGSGTTLIACENLGRKCRGIEIDPGYIGVCLERWSTLTGLTPVLLSK